MTYGTLKPDFYLKNKKYFDERLITVLENLDKKNKELKETVEIYQAKRLMDQQKIRDLRVKLKDVSVQIFNLKSKKKSDDERIKDLEDIMNNTVTNLYDELGNVIQENSDLRDRIKQLEDELKKYKSMNSVKTDSTNSNLPPSQDEFRKTGSTRPKSNKPVGGQKGHKVHRKQLEKADHIICRRVRKAPTGAEKAVDQDGNVYYAVQEISCSLQTTITEYRYYVDEANGEDLDEEVMNKYRISSVTYSSSVKALALYMNFKGAIALDRLCTMLSEISDGKINIRPGTIVNWTVEFSKLSEAERKKIADRLLKSEVLHVDETGWKVNGKIEWLHAVSNGKDALYFMTDKRSGEDGPIGFLQDYENTLTHDHFKPYYTRLPDTITHTECNAHIDRAMKRGIDQYDSIACAAIVSHLHNILNKKYAYLEEGKTCADEKDIEEIRNQYRSIIAAELERYAAENPGIPRDVEADYIKVFRRMLECEDEHLRFFTDFKVDYTNTVAERCMRTAKARKKISGQSKNMDRGKDFANIQSIIQTANWNGQNTLNTMREIIEGR